MNYNTLGTVNITDGYYDNTSGTLRLFDNAGPGNASYNPVGHVSVLNKSVSGTFTGSAANGYLFSITYHGQY